MADHELEALFSSTIPPRLEDLRRLLDHLSRNADDNLVWSRVGDALGFLKAEARQVSFPEFGFILEAMLVLPAAVREGRIRITPPHLHFLLILLEYLEGLAGGGTRPETLACLPEARIREVMFQIEAREGFIVKDLSLAHLRNQKKTESSAASETSEAEEESVLIPLPRLDALAGKLDAMIVRQFQLKKHLDLLQSLGEEAQALASELKAGRFESMAELVLKDLGRLDAGFKEDMATLDRSAFQFQEELAQFRMVPFQWEGPEWEALLSKADADVEIADSPALLDRNLLKKVQQPLLELVRNALAHGIEPASERVAQGKPGRGKVSLQCRGDRSSISIEVRDDGRGIDEAKIRASAQALFPMDSEELAAMPASRLWGYLYEPGVAAGEKTGLVSGEGLGLGMVKRSLDLLQGRVSVTSEAGRGTAFTVQFPASASLVQGFFILAGGERFFVSSVFVKEIVVLKRSDLIKLPNGSGYRLRELVVPVLPLAGALEGKELVQKPVEQMIVVELLGETFGLMVDAIVRHAALSYKGLPDSLSRMKEIQGVVYDEKFNLVPILHIPALMIHLRRLRSMEFRDRYSEDRLDYKNILVVDDGPVSRETIVQILKDAGYNVEEASDGIAAMEILEEKHFHLVVTDDVMPRMDGATFVENLRKKPEYLRIPIIALKGEENPEVLAQMKAKGVAVFLEKANFSRQDLLDKVVQLLLEYR
jgi:CheY-like chemotaxis protein